LLELSRQRLRPALSESHEMCCPRCNGQGFIRGVESLALAILRLAEEQAIKTDSSQVLIQAPPEVCNFLLNEKRNAIAGIEQRHQVPLVVLANSHMETPEYSVERIKRSEDDATPSYKRVRKPAATLGSNYISAEFQGVEQPAVSGITPATPAPVQRLEAPAEREMPEPSTGVFARIVNWFKRSKSTTANAANDAAAGSALNVQSSGLPHARPKQQGQQQSRQKPEQKGQQRRDENKSGDNKRHDGARGNQAQAEQKGGQQKQQNAQKQDKQAQQKQQQQGKSPQKAEDANAQAAARGQQSAAQPNANQNSPQNQNRENQNKDSQNKENQHRGQRQNQQQRQRRDANDPNAPASVSAADVLAETVALQGANAAADAAGGAQNAAEVQTVDAPARRKRRRRGRGNRRDRDANAAGAIGAMQAPELDRDDEDADSADDADQIENPNSVAAEPIAQKSVAEPPVVRAQPAARVQSEVVPAAEPSVAATSAAVEPQAQAAEHASTEKPAQPAAAESTEKADAARTPRKAWQGEWSGERAHVPEPRPLAAAIAGGLAYGDYLRSLAPSDSKPAEAKPQSIPTPEAHASEPVADASASIATPKALLSAEAQQAVDSAGARGD
jgi:ribonuclease E